MKTILYKDLWFEVDYTVDEYSVKFLAKKVVSIDNDGKIYEYEEEDNITGTIKWDGCVNFTQPEGMHFCDLDDAKNIYLLFKEIYKYAEESLETFDKTV